MNIEYNTWPTDNGENHFITVTKSGKSKVFEATSKKGVRKKLIDWITKNKLNYPIWKIKF